MKNKEDDKIFFITLSVILFVILALFLIYPTINNYVFFSPFEVQSIQNNSQISFASPTPSSGSSQLENSIYVNLTTSNTNESYSLVDFDNSLELFVRFDDTSSGNYIDLSAYGAYVNTTLVSGTVNGKFGNATNLSGNAQYLDIGDNTWDSRFLDYFVVGRRPISTHPALHPTSLTLSQWIYPLSNTANQAIFADMDHDQNGYSLILNTDGKLVLYMGGTAPGGTLGESGASATWTTSSSLNANQWYHIVAQMDVVNNQTKIYLDSVNQALTEVNGSIGFNYTYDFTPVSPTRLTYGARVNISTNDINSRDAFFNGYLDELLVFDRILSQTEISALYNSSSVQYSNNYTNLGYMNYSFLGYSIDVLGNKNQTTKQTVRVYNSNADTTAPNITFVSPSQTAGYANSNTTINITSTDATNKTFSFFTDSLVGWWDFDEGNGTLFPDKSGMGANGTCSGNTCPFFEHTGAFGGKYRFDGQNDFINLGTGSSPQPNNTFSISVWVKTAEKGYRKSRYILSSGSWGYYFKLDDARYDFWLAVNTSNPYDPLEVSSSIAGQFTDEQWHNVVVTFNHTSLIMYVDGNQDNIATTTYSFPAFYTADRRTNIGKPAFIDSGAASQWVDYLDELMIFNRTLTASEIKALYNASSQSYQRSFTNLIGTNNYTIKSVDAFGNLATSQIGFAIDDAIPTIIVSSPTNVTYTSSVLINFTGNDSSPLTLFYYNGLSNVTYTSPSTIAITNGNYNYIFYTRDAAGNLNYSIVNFSVVLPATNLPSQTSSSGGGGSGSSQYIYTFSQQEAETGISKALSKGDSIKIELQGTSKETHTIKLNKISSLGADIVVSSIPINLTLLIGETKEVQLNYDILVLTLENITNNRANIKIRLIKITKEDNQTQADNLTIQDKGDIKKESSIRKYVLIIFVILIVTVFLIILAIYLIPQISDYEFDNPFKRISQS